MKNSSGFTLIELAIVLTLAAIATTLAVPSFMEMFRRHRLIGAGEVLYADLQLAKSESVKMNKQVRVSFTRSGDAWCYGLSAGATCDCTVDVSDADACVISWGDDGDGVYEPGSEVVYQQRVVNSDDYQGVSVGLPGGASSWTGGFDPVNGTAIGNSGGTIVFTNLSSKELKLILSGYGRIRLCSDDGGGKVFGFEDCGS